MLLGIAQRRDHSGTMFAFPFSNASGLTKAMVCDSIVPYALYPTIR
jgi:hypothetical protein